MQLFGKGKEKENDAAAKEAEAKALAAAQDQQVAALPKTATFFDAFRTDAYMNHNFSANYVEFWVAMQVEPEADKWRVMHYMIYDLDKEDGLFKSEVASKEDTSFTDAVRQMAQLDIMCRNLVTHKLVDLNEQDYPADKYAELQAYFFGVENFKLAANIEGIAFDKVGNPHRRATGKVFGNATFYRSEINKSLTAVDQARDNPVVGGRIEGGLLSDIFNTAVDRSASLDNLLKVGQVLNYFDSFAANIGTFYLGVQRKLGLDESFESIKGLSPEESKKLYKDAEDRLPTSQTDRLLPLLVSKTLSDARDELERAKQVGVYTEPFEKFVAECELYAALLTVSQDVKKLQEGLGTIGGQKTADLIVSIRKNSEDAQAKFRALGGTDEQMDTLKAWVANPRKEPVPPWLSGFLSRYYEQRGRVMQKVQERKAGFAEVRTVSAKVKPPLV